MEDYALVFGIYLLGVVTGVLIVIAWFSDRRIKIEPTEGDGWLK